MGPDRQQAFVKFVVEVGSVHLANSHLLYVVARHDAVGEIRLEQGAQTLDLVGVFVVVEQAQGGGGTSAAKIIGQGA